MYCNFFECIVIDICPKPLHALTFKIHLDDKTLLSFYSSGSDIGNDTVSHCPPLSNSCYTVITFFFHVKNEAITNNSSWIIKISLFFQLSEFTIMEIFHL